MLTGCSCAFGCNCPELSTSRVWALEVMIEDCRVKGQSGRLFLAERTADSQLEDQFHCNIKNSVLEWENAAADREFQQRMRNVKIDDFELTKLPLHTIDCADSN